jgi:tripartite-type tricarboxylate transporter receptor subunit TctC
MGSYCRTKGLPYKTGKEFFEALKADPSKISIAVGPTLGNNDHIQFLMLAKAYGIEDVSKIKFVVYPGSGGEVVSAVLGGHVQATTISLGEIKEQYKAGNLKILEISSEKRLEGELADIPTWREQGVDLVYPMWRGVMGPGGMTPEQIAYWDDALSKMVEHESWKDAMNKQNMDIYYMNSQDFKAFLEKSTQEVAELLKTVGLAK